MNVIIDSIEYTRYIETVTELVRLLTLIFEMDPDVNPWSATAADPVLISTSESNLKRLFDLVRQIQELDQFSLNLSQLRSPGEPLQRLVTRNPGLTVADMLAIENLRPANWNARQELNAMADEIQKHWML